MSARRGPLRLRLTLEAALLMVDLDELDTAARRVEVTATGPMDLLGPDPTQQERFRICRYVSWPPRRCSGADAVWVSDEIAKGTRDRTVAVDESSYGRLRAYGEKGGLTPGASSFGVAGGA